MPQSSLLNRRDFARLVGTSALAVPALLRSAHAATDPVFTHGLASGDPLSDRVMLWTRVAPGASLVAETVLWEVARDPGFTQVLRRGRALARPQADYTVKVDALGLPADSVLYYRFVARGRTSVIGRTRTLAASGLAPVKLAVFSCSNYPAGYFHAYAEAARQDDLNAVLHLGDYLYEYPRGGYASEDAATLGREVQPATELLALADYRARYAQYRSDPDLQALHAAAPWICVWDDHEIANDAWRDGAQNHSPATEGSWAARKQAAVQAYHEWLPTRLPDATRPDRIYRHFAFGDLLDLLMLDTRLIGRDQQLDYPDYFGAAGFDGARFGADMANPARELLGTEQSAWLAQRLQVSTRPWTVLGQQVLMGRMNIPAPVVLQQISFSAYSALLFKAATAPATLTATESAILAQPAIPYNLDAWDGYAVARERLLGLSRALGKNLVVLAGDTHNAWASDLADAAGNPVGVEFATPGVSSPGLETLFPAENPLSVAAGLAQIIGPLRWADTANRGWMEVSVSAQACSADWHFVSTVKQATYTTFNGQRWSVQAGARMLTQG